MTTLTEFLLARIAEDGAAAKEVARGDTWHIDGDWRDGRTELVGGGKVLAAFTDEDRMAPHHVERWSPARVLAECEAKRRIVELWREMWESDGGVEGWADAMLAILALPYADHPDYDEAWKP